MSSRLIAIACRFMPKIPRVENFSDPFQGLLRVFARNHAKSSLFLKTCLAHGGSDGSPSHVLSDFREVANRGPIDPVGASDNIAVTQLIHHSHTLSKIRSTSHCLCWRCLYGDARCPMESRCRCSRLACARTSGGSYQLCSCRRTHTAVRGCTLRDAWPRFAWPGSDCSGMESGSRCVLDNKPKHLNERHAGRTSRPKVKTFCFTHFPALNLERLRVKSIEARLAAACSLCWS